MQRDKLFGMRIGQWVQQHSIYYGKQRRVRSDSQRKSEDRDRSEARILLQNSQAVSRIVQT